MNLIERILEIARLVIFLAVNCSSCKSVRGLRLTLRRVATLRRLFFRIAMVSNLGLNRFDGA
jgi:hypothetical protein